MSDRRQKLIVRIKELQAELEQLGVKWEKVNFQPMSENALIEFGTSLKEQLATRKKFLEREKKTNLCHSN